MLTNSNYKPTQSLRQAQADLRARVILSLSKYKGRGSFFCILFFMFFLSSCDPKRVFEKDEEIKNSIWNKEAKVHFEINISDTISAHNFYVNVRNADGYPYSNIYMFITTVFPDKKFSRDTLECILADESGKWLGSGLGDIWDNQILFKKGVRFPVQGTYRFTLEQAMRVDNLPMIMDVGLRIEKQQ